MFVKSERVKNINKNKMLKGYPQKGVANNDYYFYKYNDLDFKKKKGR